MDRLFRYILYAALCFFSPDITLAQEYVDFDRLMRDYGLVDILTLDDEILVDLRYSGNDNFIGEDMYGELDKAYFEKEFANRVVAAQQELRRRRSDLTLLVYDAARPISVQLRMHRTVQGTEFEQFVANGTLGGRHNYGVAVDVTLATADGTPLDMGTPFDDFSEAAAVKLTPDSSDPATRTVERYRHDLNIMLERGLISSEAVENRMLLIEVMYKAELVPYRREWWHFEETISMSKIREKYKLLDF
jgi:D-alanyl-D-alanine dipeptidase